MGYTALPVVCGIYTGLPLVCGIYRITIGMWDIQDCHWYVGYTLLRVCLSLILTFPYRFCPRISFLGDNFHQFSTRAVYMYSNGVGGGERVAI